MEVSSTGFMMVAANKYGSWESNCDFSARSGSALNGAATPSLQPLPLVRKNNQIIMKFKSQMDV